MLSLAKLSAFAAADSDVTLQLETINAELNIVDYQEQLSDHLLQAFGYEVENQKVLRIEEIINVSVYVPRSYLIPNVVFQKVMFFCNLYIFSVCLQFMISRRIYL